MKVLFLDVDGVLNYSSAPERFEGMLGISNSRIQLLGRLVSEIEELKIVVSSTWRKSPKLFNHLKERLEVIGVQVHDVTPDLWQRNRFVSRGHEVHHWLRRNPKVTVFACLDDDSDFLPDQKLFRTDWRYGLTEEIVEEMISYFKESQSDVSSHPI